MAQKVKIGTTLREIEESKRKSIYFEDENNEDEDEFLDEGEINSITSELNQQSLGFKDQKKILVEKIEKSIEKLSIDLERLVGNYLYREKILYITRLEDRDKNIRRKLGFYKCERNLDSKCRGLVAPEGETSPENKYYANKTTCMPCRRYMTKNDKVLNVSIKLESDKEFTETANIIHDFKTKK